MVFSFICSQAFRFSRLSSTLFASALSAAFADFSLVCLLRWRLPTYLFLSLRSLCSFVAGFAAGVCRLLLFFVVFARSFRSPALGAQLAPLGCRPLSTERDTSRNHRLDVAVDARCCGQPRQNDLDQRGCDVFDHCVELLDPES